LEKALAQIPFTSNQSICDKITTHVNHLLSSNHVISHVLLLKVNNFLYSSIHQAFATIFILFQSSFETTDQAFLESHIQEFHSSTVILSYCHLLSLHILFHNSWVIRSQSLTSDELIKFCTAVNVTALTIVTHANKPRTPVNEIIFFVFIIYFSFLSIFNYSLYE
jgi:hypothetical protein